MVPMPIPLRAAARLLVLLSLVAGCGGGSAAPGSGPGGQAPRPTLSPAYRPSGHAAAGDVFVHLFDWKWTDVASECERVLGPSGYAAVQVSPPQEHSLVPGHDWSERYQPVSYGIARSRSGTGAEFVSMVERCRAAGVAVYVDAVVNHMTSFPSPGVGSAGTQYSKYEYPGLYTRADFHTPCTLSNYQSAANVQDCELYGLPDLDTGSPAVRQKIADYLLSLARLGVAGFRIDAAKHIQPVELDAILTLVNRTVAAEGRPLPWYFAEVTDYGGEAVHASDYFGLAYASGGSADITEFRFRGIGDKFLGRGGQRLAQLDPNGPSGARFSAEAWGMMPPDKAVVFVENHDTQRSDGISYHDGQAYRLANVFMLAQSYGYPSVMSSFAFDRTSTGITAGPPSDANGNTNDVTCAANLESAAIGEWVCEHRDPYIARMVPFRRAVAGADVNHWWSDGANAIAFSRGDRGFVAINGESAPLSAAIATGLGAGSYCDLLTGGRSGGACVGARVIVDADGAAHVSLGAGGALAIVAGSRL